MPMWMNIYMQNSFSPVMEHLKFFHDHSMIIIISLSMMFIMLMFFSMKSKMFNHYYLESQMMELFWTFSPSILLMFLVIPSMKMLYLVEEMINSNFNLKITGYQWFWSYSYNEKFIKNNTTFESNLLKNNTFKLLETSNNIVLPFNIPIRVMCTSKDVIHSWTIPSLGVKMDAMPGRINQSNIIINRPGLLVGQCSEICGNGHSFMPIFLESIHFMKMLHL